MNDTVIFGQNHTYRNADTRRPYLSSSAFLLNADGSPYYGIDGIMISRDPPVYLSTVTLALLRHCGFSNYTNYTRTQDRQPRLVLRHCVDNTHNDFECLWPRNFIYYNAQNSSTASPTALFVTTPTEPRMASPRQSSSATPLYWFW